MITFADFVDHVPTSSAIVLADVEVASSAPAHMSDRSDILDDAAGNGDCDRAAVVLLVWWECWR